MCSQTCLYSWLFKPDLLFRLFIDSNRERGHLSPNEWETDSRVLLKKGNQFSKGCILNEENHTVRDLLESAFFSRPKSIPESPFVPIKARRNNIADAKSLRHKKC